jgi:hypothetical protein
MKFFPAAILLVFAVAMTRVEALSYRLPGELKEETPEVSYCYSMGVLLGARTRRQPGTRLCCSSSLAVYWPAALSVFLHSST